MIFFSQFCFPFLGPSCWVYSLMDPTVNVGWAPPPYGCPNLRLSLQLIQCIEGGLHWIQEWTPGCRNPVSRNQHFPSFGKVTWLSDLNDFLSSVLNFLTHVIHVITTKLQTKVYHQSFILCIHCLTTESSHSVVPAAKFRHPKWNGVHTPEIEKLWQCVQCVWFL